MGLDGHDRGVKLIARACEIRAFMVYSGLWQTPVHSPLVHAMKTPMYSLLHDEQLAFGVGALTGERPAELGRSDMAIDVGGIIPQEDVTMLDAGVRKIFHTGTSMKELVDTVYRLPAQVEQYDGIAALAVPYLWPRRPRLLEPDVKDPKPSSV